MFSRRIIERTRGNADTLATAASKRVEVRHSLNQKLVSKAMPVPSFSTLQQLLWDKVGIIRDRKELTEATGILAAWQLSLPQPVDRPSYEKSNLVLTGRLVTEAALLREESRGAHFRSDFPANSSQWQRHIVFTSK
ncbi:hypothetical protein ACFLV3_03010 [Chloroflexota bacterium]